MYLLDAAFVLSLFVNLIKGGELVLRPHQQKRVQAAMESLTLWADYQRPLAWLDTLYDPAVLKITGIVGILLGMSLFTTLVHNLLSVTDPTLLLARLTAVGGSMVSMWIVYNRKVDSWLTDYTAQAKSRGPEKPLRFAGFLWRFVVFVVAVIVAFFVFIFVVYFPLHILFAHSSAVNLDIMRLAVFWCVPILFPLFSVLPGGLIAITGAVALLLCSVILRALSAICWRIVEYNKGAFPALILILTIVLGCLEAYFRFIKSRP